LNERRQYTDLECIARCGKTGQVFVAEEEDHRSDADRPDEVDKRIEDRVIVDRLDVRVAIIVVDAANRPRAFCSAFINCTV
jgi:hypothetical protein